MGNNNLLKIGLLSRAAEDFKLLFALIKDYWRGDYRDVSLWSMGVFVSGIVYILVPVDILPDFIPFLGQMDDALILLLCLYFLEKDLHKYKKWRMSR
ncbi:MAG: YkvA family protein [Desulfobacteraceae bacterium]